jgi:Lamin Tail Domain
VRCFPAFAIWLCACEGLKVPTARGKPASEVEIEPAGDLGAAPAVLRLRVHGAAGRAALRDFRVFEGALSSYYLNRLAARDEPETLLEREVSVLTWADARDVVVAPASALAAGTYTLATPDLGALAEVTVDPALVPWVARRWPPSTETTGDGFSVFCGDAAPAVSEGPVMLAPSGTAAEVRAGIGDDGLFAADCVTLTPELAASGTPELPPVLCGGAALEPLPLFATNAPVLQTACAEGELALGPACATVDDDRVTLRAPSEPSLWAIAEPERLLEVAAEGASVVVHGFEPDAAVRFRASAFDRAGAETSVDVWLTGAPRRDHVVINEVLANPRGVEASSEWVELANDGAEAVDLEGLEFADSGGSVVLPAASVAPGELVLLAANGFAPDPDLDVAPALGTRVVLLPKLGERGLSNAGELLRLSDASGRLLSRFPALAASDPGVSLARRTPDAPDDDDTAFGLHAPPGASPGAPNELAPAP